MSIATFLPGSQAPLGAACRFTTPSSELSMPLLRSWRITFRGGLATNRALLTELSRLLMSVKNAGQARRHTIASPEPRRSTSIPRIEVLRRGFGGAMEISGR